MSGPGRSQKSGSGTMGKGNPSADPLSQKDLRLKETPVPQSSEPTLKGTKAGPRWEEAQKIFSRNPTAKEWDLIEEVHKHAQEEIGADGVNPARLGNYTDGQKLRKAFALARGLEELGHSRPQALNLARQLLDRQVAGLGADPSRAAPPQITENGTLKDIKPFNSGANNMNPLYEATMVLPTGEQVKVILKGRKPGDGNGFNNPQNEALASRLSRYLELPAQPPETIYLKNKGSPYFKIGNDEFWEGSVSVFQATQKLPEFKNLPPPLREAIATDQVFRFLIGDPDGHGGQYRLSADGTRVVAFDYAAAGIVRTTPRTALSAEQQARLRPEHVLKEPLPPKLQSRLKALDEKTLREFLKDHDHRDQLIPYILRQRDLLLRQ